MDASLPAEVVGRLEWRYATQRFDPSRRIPDADWDALERALVLTPSSWGLQPWTFVVVTDPAVRAELRGASWNQRQITESSHVVVFAVRTRLDEAFVDAHLRRIAEVRGVAPETLAGFRRTLVGFLSRPRDQFDPFAWASLQAYIALGGFMTAAAMMAIDTCPMEGIVPARYDEILGLAAQDLRTVVVCCAGYRSADDPFAAMKKVRFPREVVTRHV
jgi:nitroreductase